MKTASVSGFLKEILARQLDQQSLDWLDNKLELIKDTPRTRDLFLTFSAIPRFLGKNLLELNPEDLDKADEISSGFTIEGWSVPRAARVLVVCSYPYPGEKDFVEILDQLFATGEVSELVALYSALPVLPYPEALKARTSEGVRTNMTVVFDAVVLNNPYPAEYLDENAWNQMVLKALFMGRPLFRIVGLDQRCNAQLTKMISDYAHERWAAGRDTSPEMWRPVGSQGIISIYDDLEKLAGMSDANQQAAAVLTADSLGTKEAASFLDHHPELVKQVKENDYNWDVIGRQWLAQQDQN